MAIEMSARIKTALSFVLLVGTMFASSLSHAQEKTIFLGEAEDGTRIMLEPRLNRDYRTALRYIDQSSLNRPKTATEYVNRMKANCSKRFRGNGALGMLAMMGPELIEEIPQELAGDMIGFAGAQVAAAPQDDPGWFIHWAEGSISGDMLTQISIAVVAQVAITKSAYHVMNDVCQYYLAPSRKKLPIPLDGIEDGAGARQLAQMTPDEATIMRRIYNRVRVRRAMVNGGAMGVGMVIGQNFIEAKNDPNLRMCARQWGKKRWGDVSEFAQYNTACRTAARSWFSKSKAADLSMSIISSLLSGTATYGLREAGGAAMHATGMMDRSALLRYLSSPELRNRLARRALLREGGKAAIYTIRGLKFFGKTTATNFAIEVALEAATGIVVYNVDQHVVRPILIPWAKQEAFKWEMRDDIGDLDSSLDRILSGNHNYERTAYTSTGGIVPTSQAIKVAVPSYEAILQNIIFKNSQWREHITQDVNEIRSNWMDAVKYPDAVMSQGKTFYETIIDLGGHDSLYPTPLTWDFFTNAESKFKGPMNQALARLAVQSEDAKSNLDNLIYELDTAYHYVTLLSSADGRRKLLNDKLVSAAFLERVAQPEIQAMLQKDSQKLMAAGTGLVAAYEGRDVEQNVRTSVQTLVALVNDPGSIFGFPDQYRFGDGSSSAAYARTLRGRFADIGSRYGYYDQSDNCRELNSNGSRRVKKVERWPVPNTNDGKLALRFRCNNEERYAFVNGVYQNRLYVALKNYVGYPFKLQPKVEDVEQILNVVSNGELFQANQLKAITPAKPYSATSPLLAEDVSIFGIRLPGRESAMNVRLYSNLDLFVNRMLCGVGFGTNFVGNIDVPILKKFKDEGLRMKMDAPRIAVELDGRSIPSVCDIGVGMAYTKYVDYYSKDFMFADRRNVAPMRTVLNYTGSVAGDPGANGAVPVPRQYTDFLDLAMRRVNPEFLKNPSLFAQRWQDRITKPYVGFAEDRGLQGRYEGLMKQTMRQLGTVWRRKGDYNKCMYRQLGDFLNCTSDNAYVGTNLMNPFFSLSAFHQHHGSHAVARNFNSSLVQGMDQFVRDNLETPMGQLKDQSGRGLFAATSSELALYEKVLWKMTKNLSGRLARKGVNTTAEVSEIKMMLRRLVRANELTWQLIDENAPTNPTACNAAAVRAGCTGSRIAAYSIVEAVLPIVAHPVQRAYLKNLEIAANARLLPTVRTSDNRLATNISNNSDIAIDEMMTNFANNYGITPENGYGKFRAEFPRLAYTFSRTDSFFRTAKVFAKMSVELDLLRVTHDIAKMIWMKKDGKYVVESGVDRLVMTSVAVETIRAIRSNFVSIHNQVALFDAFKRGGDGDQKIDQGFKEIEELAHKLSDIVTSTLDHKTETSCEHRLILDRIYKARPDLNRSVSCAVEAGQLDLTRSNIRTFENVIR